MGDAASRGTRRFGPLDWLDRIRLTGPNTDLRQGLERDILPKYLTRCRWYAAKDAGPPLVEIIDLVTCPEPIDDTVLALLRVTPPGREPQRYVLPLALAWADEGGLPDRCIAHVKRDARLAALIDSFEADRVVRGLLDAMLAAGPAAAHGAPMAFGRTAALAAHLSRLAKAGVERIAAEQSNTSVRFAEVAILKLFRRLEPGIHPELEIGRFLTEAGFANTPQLLGWIELHPSGSEPAVLAVLQELLTDATDGWSFVLQRLRDCSRSEAAASLTETPMLDLARQLGQRTAELHRAFAAQSEDPAFAPEPVTPVMLRAWRDGARAMAASALGALAQAAPGLPPATREQVDMVLARREQLLEQIDALLPETRGRGVHPPARRLPSRAGFGRQRRRVHHRFRRRADAPARGAPRQAGAAARRRGHAALLRVCRSDHPHGAGCRCRRFLARCLGGRNVGRVPRRLSRADRRLPEPAGRSR